MKTCETVMTKKPICCLPTDSVVKVAQLMKRENIGSVPVIENEQTRKLGRNRDRSRSGPESCRAGI